MFKHAILFSILTISQISWSCDGCMKLNETNRCKYTVVSLAGAGIPLATCAICCPAAIIVTPVLAVPYGLCLGCYADYLKHQEETEAQQHMK